MLGVVANAQWNAVNNHFTLIIVLLNVVIPSVVMLSVAAPFPRTSSFQFLRKICHFFPDLCRLEEHGPLSLRGPAARVR